MMDRETAVFVDGIGAAAATSGVLTQLQGRIFGLLYLQPHPMPLEDIAAELEQSKSHVSVNIRGLVEWHLVRRVSVGRSRKDHYEAATDLWRVTQEIMERRFRWNLRQVLAAVDEAKRISATRKGRPDRERASIQARLEALRAFAQVVDDGIGAFGRGESFAPQSLQRALEAIPIASAPSRRRS
jgi:DNA-binding transcriptional regulator GbsR (MarR family)